MVGPDAAGTTVTALLHTAEHLVLVCGHASRDSIKLRPDGNNRIMVPGPIGIDPNEVTSPVDVLVLAVKATQNE
ncbi:hypothetical protein [Mycobacterium uberis]|uniref:hypothetical protein n=1 Tax=Mycobacterium uberis TaxID=2162698 RepID=UPI000E30ADA9|nr:hypothetical protein [Mycobacterium uberis]